MSSYSNPAMKGEDKTAAFKPPRRQHRRTKPLPRQESGEVGGGPASSATWTLSMISSTSARSIMEGSWGIPGDIPRFEVNNLAYPTGDFYEHIRNYAVDQASKEFPWHLDWNKQCPEQQALFAVRLKEIYKGPWDPKLIMQEVGGNLRERRARLRRKFKSYKNWRLVPIPLGCSKFSWMKIHEDMSLPKMEKLSASSKAAAEARIGRVGYSHKWGPCGQRGLVKRFVRRRILLPTVF
jgi:hypothetical protein